MTGPVDSRVSELFGEYLERSPFAKLLGLRLQGMEADPATIVLPFREDLAT